MEQELDIESEDQSQDNFNDSINQFIISKIESKSYNIQFQNNINQYCQMLPTSCSLSAQKSINQINQSYSQLPSCSSLLSENINSTLNLEKNLQQQQIEQNEFQQKKSSIDQLKIQSVIVEHKFNITLPQGYTNFFNFNSLISLKFQNKIIVLGQNYILDFQIDKTYNTVQSIKEAIPKDILSRHGQKNHLTQFSMCQSGLPYSKNVQIIDWETNSVKNYNLKKQRLKSQTKPKNNNCSNWYITNVSQKLVAYGSMDKNIYVINSKKKIIKELKGHTSTILGLQTLPKGKIASSSNDQSLRIWSLLSGKEIECFGKQSNISNKQNDSQQQLNNQLEQQPEFKYHEFSSIEKLNNQYLAATTWTDKVIIYDYVNMKEYKVLENSEMINNWSVRQVLDQYIIVSGFSDKVFVWNWKSGVLVHQVQNQTSCIREMRVIKNDKIQREAIVAGVSQKCQLIIWKFQNL